MYVIRVKEREMRERAGEKKYLKKINSHNEEVQ